MANLYEYLDWRGDVPFQVDPFNDVDALLLAFLSYTGLEGVFLSEPLTATEAAARFFALHSVEEILAQESFVKTAPLILEKVGDCPRFAGLRVIGYINHVDEKNDEQMSATAYLVGDGSVYVAFRGTDDTIAGWREDFNLSYLAATPGQMRARDFLNEVLQSAEGPVRVGGHSKGGNFAVYASAFAESKLLKRIAQVYSFDGPGFRDEIVHSPEYEAVLPNVVSVIPESSLIGVILSGRYRHQVVKSNVTGIVQHDALSWQVYGNRFVPGQRSSASLYMDRVCREWLGTLSDENRKFFSDTLFSFLEGSETGSISEALSDRRRLTQDMLRVMGDMPRERRQEFLDIIGQFVRQSMHQTTAEAITGLSSLSLLRREGAKTGAKDPDIAGM